MRLKTRNFEPSFSSKLFDESAHFAGLTTQMMEKTNGCAMARDIN